MRVVESKITNTGNYQIGNYETIYLNEFRQK